MLRLLLISFLSLSSINSFAQSNETESIPDWAQLMYDNSPNVYAIDQQYYNYFQTHDYEKNTHTQYYKRWRRSIDRYVNDEGMLDPEFITKMNAFMQNHQEQTDATQAKMAGNWTLIGPTQERKSGGVLSSRQANVRSIAISASNPNVVFCGTEPGEIYKSTDGGASWTNVSFDIVTAYTTGSVTSNASIMGLAIVPDNPDKVFAISGNEIFITNDGGMTWNNYTCASAPLFGYIETPEEIQIDPNDYDHLFVAGLDGLRESFDGGITWSQVFAQTCYDIKFQPGTPTTVYALREGNGTDRHEFVKSTNSGATWTVMTGGWYGSTDNNRTVGGGRIAVSPANPNQVFAFLIGNSKSGDEGFIGLYKSTDAGVNWVNTLGYDGGPYTAAHPNLIASNPLGGFNQGMYNCALMISNSDPNDLLVGGINLWKSEDGGLTFFNLADYYQPGLYDIHVDQQDFRSLGSTYWVTNDGGIYKTNDFFDTEPEFTMNGVHAADFWGFGSGWNFDILTGGTFHNGLDVWTETYPNGEFFSISPGEPASGYVSPGDSTRVFWTGNSTQAPTDINGSSANYYSLGVLPNESPWFAESSKLLFHPNCYNHIYTGNDNMLMKSEDGGSNFNTLFTAPANSQVFDIEISRPNSEIMYAVVINSNFTAGTLYKTTDHWATSSTVNLPAGGGSRILIDLDVEDENTLWLCYPRGSNGQKVFKSTDGGASWANITSSELDDQRIYAMAAVGGTNGGVYINTNVNCYYRNDAMSSWTMDNLGLPTTITTREIFPFYRDGKVRIGSYGKGVWESPLYEDPDRPVAQIMANQLSANCAGDLFYFDDYSMLNHSGASWLWTFENGSVATSTLRNPVVSFTSYGSNLVTLTVTDGNGVSSTDSLYITLNTPGTIISEEFEGTFPPNDWKMGLFAGWIKTTDAGGFGNSTSSMLFDNYSISSVGTAYNIETAIDLTNANASDCQLYFDVAYAKYASNYADTLEVLVSTDCGNSWTSMYYSGGDDLATAPDETTTGFIPTQDQWRKDSIDLSVYAGEPNLSVRFSNINAYGQRLYIDNVNLAFTSNVSIAENELTQLELYPNPITSNGHLQILHSSESGEILTVSLYTNSGKLLGTKKTNNGISLAEWNLAPGAYIVSIQSQKGITQSKLIVAGKQ